VNNGGKKERSSLRRKIGWKYSVLDPILVELKKEGKIKMSVVRQGDMISLKK
jgi:hypothetical protein